MEIGRQIRRFRSKMGLTLEELASRTELSKGFLSQLENDLTSPSIATLADICEVLGVSLTAFFKDIEEERYTFCQDDFFVDEQDNYVIKWIIPNAQKNKMEPILLELEPEACSKEIMPHEGEEFGLVLQGKVKLKIEDITLNLKKGETFYLKGDRTHYLENSSSAVAKVLWVSSPPIF